MTVPLPEAASDVVVQAVGLRRRFGSLVAVDAVSFEARRGEILGFIGPNGAGKTTTMRMVTGYLPATEGKATVAGFDVFDDNMQVRRRVGYLPERPPLYPELTIGAYLQFVGELRGLSRAFRDRRIGEVMERVGLAGWEDRVLGSLSKGYRQRVGLAQAVLHDPEVLVLDEPTSGLDPAQVVDIRAFIRDLAQDRTVILSTHILSEVERLCRRAVLIARGRVVAQGSLDALRSRVDRGVRFVVELRHAEPAVQAAMAARIGALPEVERVRPVDPDARDAADDEGFLSFVVQAEADPRTAIARLATAEGWTLRAMERRAPDLEEAFLHIVGKEGHTQARGEGR